MAYGLNAGLRKEMGRLSYEGRDNKERTLTHEHRSSCILDMRLNLRIEDTVHFVGLDQLVHERRLCNTTLLKKPTNSFSASVRRARRYERRRKNTYSLFYDLLIWLVHRPKEELSGDFCLLLETSSGKPRWCMLHYPQISQKRFVYSFQCKKEEGKVGE